MKQADTLPALAAACGIDPAGLVASVERFNGFCATGVDADFGRGSNVYNRYYGDPTVKPNPCLGPIEQGPFQAIPLWPGDAGTAGGACINEHAQVLRADASPIEGLYAAGNSTASLSGPFYAGAGLSIGASTISGGSNPAAPAAGSPSGCPPSPRRAPSPGVDELDIVRRPSVRETYISTR
jgi:3-oxosteroid 1-dehydrogenase